ncbi:MAG: hypothetical protein E7012_03020 [Alphaproteobacteria bacterium]|nr:hypothetical protein [Alphaproteobacteria bacterium]
MKLYIFIIAMVLLPISASLAQTSCVTPPSCSEMGYTQTESECAGKEIVLWYLIKFQMIFSHPIL